MNPVRDRKDFVIRPAANGFTLIEILVAAVIITTLSVVFVLNFRVSAKNKTARLQATSIIVSDIRRTESMALSGSRFQGNIVCGYGIHYIGSTTYLIYAKPKPGGSNCASIGNKNYVAANDLVVETKNVFNPNIEIRSSFNDAFFSPPNPTIYINNDSSLTRGPEPIIIQIKGQPDCTGQPCTTINVYTSGRLDIL